MDAESADARTLWKAAAAAMEWTAAMRGHAAWAARRRGWAAKAEADDDARRVAEECGRAVDGQGVMDVASLRRVEGAMRRAADPLVRASRALARSSRLYEAAESDLLRASRAHRRAGDREYAATVAERAANSRDHAQELAGLAAGMLAEAESLRSDAARLADGTAGESPGLTWQADRAALSSSQSEMMEDSRRARAKSARMLAEADETVRAAEMLRQLTAGAAEASAAGAAEAAARGRGMPGVARAAAAWRRAVARAHAVDGRRGRARRTGERGG